MIRLALVAIAALTITSSAHAGCSMTSAGGIGVTKDIATFMSNKALKNMTDKLGEKASGAVTTTCDVQLLVSNCISKQRTCK